MGIPDRLKNIAEWLLEFNKKKGAPFVIGLTVGILPLYEYYKVTESVKEDKANCIKEREDERDKYYADIKAKDDKYDDLERKFIEQNQLFYDRWIEHIEIQQREYSAINKDIRDNERIIKEANDVILNLKKIKKEK